jgi:hypothetical protein
VSPSDDSASSDFEPRLGVNLSKLYECSQDQWDLYKLDPAYECVVHAPPNLPTISKAEPRTPESPRSNGKRSILTPSPERDASQQETKRKLQRMVPALSESESEMEVEGMVVNERLPRGERLKKVREQFDKDRKIRREKIHAKYQRVEELDEMIYELQQESSQSQSRPPTSSVKRKGEFLTSKTRLNTQTIVVPESSISRDASMQGSPERNDGKRDTNTTNIRYYKRTRTVSPESLRRELEEKRTERRQQKAGKWGQKLDQRRHMRERVFMDEILKDVPDHITGWPLYCTR